MRDIRRDVFGKSGGGIGRIDRVKFWVEARRALTVKEYIAYELHIQGESEERIAVQMGEYVEDVGLLIRGARRKMKAIASRYTSKPRKKEVKEESGGEQ